jgi:hypothetical protein
VSSTIEKNLLRSLSVIIPVFGQRPVLESHILHHEDLYRICGETIWVVTPSSDGAHQVAQEAAERLGGTYLQLEPGLYQAWNSGIHQAKQDWIYFNTVGDFCEAINLTELLEKAVESRADVAFSPPRNAAQDPQLRQWPIVTHASTLDQGDGQIIPPATMTRLQLLAGESNFLGSMAGAVFSAAYLKKFPFRSNFKSFGDTAWVYEHCLSASFLYAKNPVATFLSHESARQGIHSRDTGRLLHLLLSRYPSQAQSAIRESVYRYLLLRRLLNRVRGARPGKGWFFFPAAAGLRIRRQRAFARMVRLFLRHMPVCPAP